VDVLLQAIYLSPPNLGQFQQNLKAIKDHLLKTRGFALNDQDTITVRHVAETFFRAGPDISYNTSTGGGGLGGGGRGGMPSYGSMAVETDLTGSHRSYLASEASYAFVRGLQLNNLIVPIVGDFAGPKALRTIGQYTRERGSTIRAFYTSNVEQYLFQDAENWARFYSNVATLPLDSTSTLIRSAPTANVRSAGATGWPGPRSTMLLSYLTDIVTAFRSGKVVSYTDVLALSR
jgi:hypothetical protein